MRKTFKISYCLILLVILFLFSCSNNKVTVSFYCENELVKEEKIPKGTYPHLVDPLEIDGLIFEGWYTDDGEFDFNTPINEDLTVYASYVDREYKIVFKNEDGSVLKSKTYFYAEKIEPPVEPTKRSDDDYDYTFSKWSVDFDYVTEDLVIVAEYTKSVRKYKVVLYNEDYTLYDTLLVEKGSTFTTPTLSKEDDDYYTYTFDKWYLNDYTEYDFSKPLTSDIQMIPHFFASPKEFSLEGKRLSIMGDSMSTFYSATSDMNSYYSGNDEFYYPKYSSNFGGGLAVTKASQTWWGQLVNNLGLELGINNSLSGSSCYGGSSSAAMSEQRINTLGENGTPDIIICVIGGNDNVNGHTLAQFDSAYGTMLKKIHKKYPNAYIVCVTCGYTAYSGYNYSEDTRLAYNNIMRKYANFFGYAIADLSEVQTKDTYASMLGDSMHPNLNGMTIIAKTIEDAIKDYFNITE